MKLSTARIQQTLEQLEDQTAFEGAMAIPDDNPAVTQLNEVFGDHTFFVDRQGLHIVEPAARNGGEPAEGQVIKLASWADPSCTALTPHRPEPTDTMVVLGPEE